MTQKDNILNELQELNSRLAGVPKHDVFTVPVGYFEGLAELVLNRIKALEAASVTEELGHLSPVLSRFSKEMPYQVPQGYFEALEKNILTTIHQTGQSASDELKEISPFLAGLKKETPFSVPQGYFDSLSTPVTEEKPTAKVVSFTSRNWFKYAAAAVVTGVILLAAFFVINKQNSDPAKSLAKFEKKLDKEIKKTSDKELTDFIQDVSGNDVSKEDVALNKPDDEIKELLKDVSETELKKFLEETSDAETATDEEALLFN